MAREEGLGEEEVVRGLLADAYGRAGRPRDEWWFPHSAKRVASVLPRQLEPLDPEVVERERSKGVRLSDLDTLRTMMEGAPWHGRRCYGTRYFTRRLPRGWTPAGPWPMSTGMAWPDFHDQSSTRE